jgi:hypothetical protein
MKKLLFLMLIVFSIQCENKEPKEKCGIVTEMVTVPSDTKSKPKSIPISYMACEYIVIMPQGTDTLQAKKYLEANNFKLVKMSEFNTSMGLYTISRNDGSDGNPPPPVKPPKPIIVLRNGFVLDENGLSTTEFNLISRAEFNQRY